MFDSRHRFFPPLVDLGLLAGLLKLGFWLNPVVRPELAMLGTAIVVQLFLGPRAERFAGQALMSATGIFLLFAFYWERPGDAWPLLGWLPLLVVWRARWDRREGFPAWMLRVESGVARLGDGLTQRMRPVTAPLQAPCKRVLDVLGGADRRRLPVLVLVITAVPFMWPYLTEGIVGAGDARWYSSTVADYVIQMRAGFFPVWLGQGEYSFYGGVFPVRLAPYLAHAAGLVDIVTARQLPPYAVMNAVLGFSLLGGLLSMYFCLRAVVRDRPWTMAGLALCYVLCPGVMGLAYASDLYMSFCTLPFLPVALLGAYRSFTRDDPASRLMMAGGLSAAWLAHPPIGLWCGLVLLATQVIRLVAQPSWRRTWVWDLLAAALFFLLTAASFASVWSLGPILAADVAPDSILLFIRRAFPANWLPPDASVNTLSNLQIGYGLVALGGFAGLAARGAGTLTVRVFLGCAAGLVLVLVPIPLVTAGFWRMLPQTVLNITNMWPAQRLVVLAAGCTVFGVAAWLATARPAGPRERNFSRVLLAALLWGGLGLLGFIRVCLIEGRGWDHAALLFRAENRTMTEAALGPHPVRPRYFNHGVTSVQLEHRFLDPVDRRILRNVTDSILPGFGPGSAALPRRLTQQFGGQTEPDDATILNLSPVLTLEPGKFYLLALEFLEHDYQGTLLFQGKDFHRVYGLPAAGFARSFGAGPEHSRWIALWQTTGKPEEVRLRWLPAGVKNAMEHVPFANFELKEYDPAALDVVVESLLPYRVSVNAPADCYLETVRLNIPGYRAVLDGREVPVEMSPDGFIMVRMGPGRHVLELPYTAPLVARLGFWLSAAGWAGFAGLCLVTARRLRAQRRAS